MAFFSQNIMQVDFESIDRLEVSQMVEMFRSLEATGLKRFLGGTNGVHEEEVRQFFQAENVMGDSIISTVKGSELTVSKQVFAQFFELPT